jgi:VIT1/CCC1 family predicted Fe2+/Mn2+ transporter
MRARTQTVHPGEPHHPGAAGRTNWLRAGVLGANDGIVSVAALLVGIAGATQDRAVLLVAGLSGIAAGALSMGVGEYVSVSTQRDTERALLQRERGELATDGEAELAELTGLYAQKGLDQPLARQVAEQLTERDALRSHAEAELSINPDELVNPWAAAGSSVLAFTLGALLPFLAIVLPPSAWRIPVAVVAVLLALAATGFVSARLGGARPGTAVTRVVAGGALAMAITYGIGRAVGVAV